MLLAVVLALIAACSNAASNVIQRATNRQEKGVRTLSLRLIEDLLHRPLWFGGIGFVTLSFLLQASALKFGPLALVEPLLVFELPLTLVGASALLGSRMGWLEWAAAIIMTLGLAGLIFFLHPHGGSHGTAPAITWIVGLGLSQGAVAGLVVTGRRSAGDLRAALYGAATGIEFGTTAALMKGAVGHLSQGITALFGAWETYAMIAAGIFAMFLVQNALQAGKILAAQPGITLLDPIVAIVWGVLGFGELTSGDGVHLAIAAAGGVLMVAGALMLSRSPVLENRR